MRNVLAICFLFLMGCASHDQTPSESRVAIRECRVHFYKGGVASKKLARNKNLESFQVTVTTNRSLISNPENGVVVDAASMRGRRIVALLESEKPWVWKKHEFTDDFNNLYLDGRCGEKTWKYVSTFPDKNLERFVVLLKRELEKD